MHLSSLHLHPVKSCARLDVETLTIEPRGPRHDRRWMVVDADGRCLTGRELPRMVLIRATPHDDGLHLQAPEMPALRVPVPPSDGARMDVTIWKDRVDAALAGAQADAWLSRFLGRAVRLVHIDARSRRPVAPDYARPGDEVSFADAFPLLLISQASLDGLNAKLETPLPMARFRPNLVIAGCAPHAEDGWTRIRIGAIEFDVVKPCTRCVLTTVDPASGTFDASGEPLRTLKTYRRLPAGRSPAGRSSAGITFGVNLIARGTGSLRVGDAVQALA